MILHMAYINREMGQVTPDQIRQAWEAGNCRYVHSYGENHTKTSLSLDGEDVDTREKTFSVWEETWTRPVETLQKAMQAAFTRI